MDRNLRLRASLDGLSVGDAFGERVMMSGPGRLPHVIAEKDLGLLGKPPWRTTDDTEMACEIAGLLEERGRIDQDELALRFARRHNRDPARGYGAAAHAILDAIHGGSPWREVAYKVFRGQGSMGNGGAMRAAPIGAFFSEDVAQVIEQARLSAEVTHAHPDGQAGAIAVALAAAWAVRNEGSLFDFVLRHVPEGPTRFGLEKAAGLPHLAPFEAGEALGNGSQVISSDTVPFCLWMAARSPDDYEAALWNTAEQLGDIDTNCAIIGGIVALRSPIPPAWLAAREALH